MIVHRATTLWTLFSTYWGRLLIVFAIVVIDEYANSYIVHDIASLDLTSLGLLTTAFTIFLVFRVNEAYGRWWEARTLWGGLVNFSRTFARQITTLVGAGAPHGRDKSSALKRELVHRHIAYVNALRMNLRRQDDWDSLGGLIGEEELDRLKLAKNKPTQLLQTQGARVADARREGLIDGYDHLMIDNSLTEIYNVQGGCERIKNTVFPDRVAYLTEVTVWVLAVLIPLAVIRVNQTWETIDVVVVTTMIMVLVMAERFGAELKNPFENLPNDTPMTALCRTIEIDVREQLGEGDLPEPVQPTGGVLM